MCSSRTDLTPPTPGLEDALESGSIAKTIPKARKEDPTNNHSPPGQPIGPGLRTDPALLHSALEPTAQLGASPDNASPKVMHAKERTRGD
jgi:hypothetical protein